MQFTTTLLPLAAILSQALAAPLPQEDNWFANVFSWFSGSSSPTLPSSTLPAPPSNLALKHIAVGLGTQNYTCADNSATTVPTAIGALANLYDATQRFSTQWGSGQASIQWTPCAADHTDSSLGMNQIGQHFFDASGVPNFNLWGWDAYLTAKKIASATAPSNACTGRNGETAVAWLNLEDNGSGESHGVSMVYRVETAGGNPPSCSTQTPGVLFTSDYSAEYWFYG